MSMLDTLSASRSTWVLIDRPGSNRTASTRKWSLDLTGLSQDHLRAAANSLRKRLLTGADQPAQKRSLKSTALLDSLSRALGARSYDHWLTIELPKITALLREHNMSRPTDLIKWATPAGAPLGARQLADRLFNSGMPIPQRIFTGVGSPLFASSGYGRIDIDYLAGFHCAGDEQRYNFCQQYNDQILIRADYMHARSDLAYLDLTGRMLMLNSVRECVDAMFNLLGSNLMDPQVGKPIMRLYNSTDDEASWQLRLFQMFREEIESSDAGWVEIIRIPDNTNLIFLKGQNGAFDWVVRDQRDGMLSTNQLHHFFSQDEIPEAMDQGKLLGHLYYSTAKWYEQLEHESEVRHYEEGGSAANWPGYRALIERELVAAHEFHPPRQPAGRVSENFVSHRLNERCVMVSSLITIAEFRAFSERTDWELRRANKAKLSGFQGLEHLVTINSRDSDELPMAVAWLDAVAYCRDFEQRTGLPVRLLTANEWRQITPPPTIDVRKIKTVRSFMVKPGERPNDPIYEQLDWGVIGADGRLGPNSADSDRADGVMSYSSRLNWIQNDQGLSFLSTAGFGEWLADHRNHHAPAVCTATHQSIVGGDIERSLCPVDNTMRYKGAKIGFRLCYVAAHDA